MHEISTALMIIEAVKAAVERHGLETVEEVTVACGEGAGLDPETLQEALLLMADSRLTGVVFTLVPGSGPEIRRIKGTRD
jgi:Zn finger protein HypA/HybF involved in hydrogenase expression